jgi:hypothetical protein
MASLVYNAIKAAFASAVENWNVSQYKVTLVGSAYAAAASHVYASAFSGAELSSTSFTGGFSGTMRKALSATSAVVSQASNVAQLLAAATVTWSAISAGTAIGLVVLRESGSDALSPLVAFFDTSTISTAGGNVTVSWAAGGVMQFA